MTQAPIPANAGGRSEAQTRRREQLAIGLLQLSTQQAQSAGARLRQQIINTQTPDQIRAGDRLFTSAMLSRTANQRIRQLGNTPPLPLNTDPRLEAITGIAETPGINTADLQTVATEVAAEIAREQIEQSQQPLYTTTDVVAAIQFRLSQNSSTQQVQVTEQSIEAINSNLATTEPSHFTPQPPTPGHSPVRRVPPIIIPPNNPHPNNPTNPPAAPIITIIRGHMPLVPPIVPSLDQVAYTIEELEDNDVAGALVIAEKLIDPSNQNRQVLSAVAIVDLFKNKDPKVKIAIAAYAAEGSQGNLPTEQERIKAGLKAYKDNDNDQIKDATHAAEAMQFVLPGLQKAGVQTVDVIELIEAARDLGITEKDQQAAIVGTARNGTKQENLKAIITIPITNEADAIMLAKGAIVIGVGEAEFVAIIPQSSLPANQKAAIGVFLRPDQKYALPDRAKFGFALANIDFNIPQKITDPEKLKVLAEAVRGIKSQIPELEAEKAYELAKPFGFAACGAAVAAAVGANDAITAKEAFSTLDGNSDQDNLELLDILDFASGILVVLQANSSNKSALLEAFEAYTSNYFELMVFFAKFGEPSRAKSNRLTFALKKYIPGGGATLTISESESDLIIRTLSSLGYSQQEVKSAIDTIFTIN